ncbi:MAG TPA: uracil-DNA glycosylase [Alphaproteobacteria bacterium]|nr:uracil-DNA glycosylase [Alphaproteobacteria bacterium]
MTRSSQTAKPTNCFECRHHFITHEQQRPYGCRRFGFKAPFLPSQIVFRETGMKCAYYEPRQRPLKGRRPTGSNGRLA